MREWTEIQLESQHRERLIGIRFHISKSPNIKHLEKVLRKWKTFIYDRKTLFEDLDFLFGIKMESHLETTDPIKSLGSFLSRDGFEKIPHYSYLFVYFICEVAVFETRFSQITNLSLSNIKLLYLPPNFVNLKSLEHISLNHNLFIKFPKVLFEMPSLKTVSLLGNILQKLDSNLNWSKFNTVVLTGNPMVGKKEIIDPLLEEHPNIFKL